MRTCARNKKESDTIKSKEQVPQRTLPLKFWQNKKCGFFICDCYLGFGDLPQELFHSRLLRILLHINRCVCIGKTRDLCVIDFRKFVAGKARANTAVKMSVKISVKIWVSFFWSRFDTYHHAFKFFTHIFTHSLTHKFCIELLPMGLQRWGININKVIAKHVFQ